MLRKAELRGPWAPGHLYATSVVKGKDDPFLLMKTSVVGHSSRTIPKGQSLHLGYVRPTSAHGAPYAHINRSSIAKQNLQKT